jgi:proteasome alpha subunit
MGGAAESVTKYLEERYTQGLSRDDALKLAAAALGHSETGHRDIPARDLEVAVLDRTRTQERKFKRLDDRALAEILAGPEATSETPGPSHRAPEGTADETTDGVANGATDPGPEGEPPVAP